MNKSRKLIPIIMIGLILMMESKKAFSQSSGSAYPTPTLDESLIPPSPNAASLGTYGTIPVSLYEGIPNVNIPIFTVKCGSLSVPISLNYNYNGLRPREDAGWTGLGWTLAAGGCITRIVQGQPDDEVAHPYDQYNLYDSLYQSNNKNFLQQANDNYLYDLAPDVYCYQFDRFSGKFIYYNEKAYTMPFEKLNIVHPVDNEFQIIDGEGITYIFSATETTYTQFNPVNPKYSNFISSWYLTSIISADKKDTINLNYSNTADWYETVVPYNNTEYYPANCGPQQLYQNYLLNTSVQSEILQSITCNNTTVNFNSGSRLDLQDYPELNEIDVINNLSGSKIKRYLFQYNHFYGYIFSGSTTDTVRTLRLDQFAITNPQETSSNPDSSDQIYRFKYMDAYVPSKSTNAIDYWGFCNGGSNSNQSLFPEGLVPFPSGGNRDPNFPSCSEGALDTIVYPSGGYATLQYQLNTYGIFDDTTHNYISIPGPGICIKSISSFAYDSLTPTNTLSYNYSTDYGNYSSGTLLNATPGLSVNSYTYDNCTNQVFQVSNNGSYGGLFENDFYYTEVSVTDTAGKNIHKTSYYFNTNNYAFDGVHLVYQEDYNYDTTVQKFTPVRSMSYNYQDFQDTDFIMASIQLTGRNDLNSQDITETFSFDTTNITPEWNFLASKSVTSFDHEGGSVTTTTNYSYNSQTKNLASIESNTSDGREIIQEFKYPEDYTSDLTGNMVANHVLNPVIEEQTWLKSDAADSEMTAGKITLYDQNIFKPTDEYFFQDTIPVTALSNNGQANGLYTSLISDSHYADRLHFDYDAYDDLEEQDKTGSESNSYIWGYDHSYPVAVVKNATESQIAYTSFETSDEGNWSYSGATSSGGKTGNYSYSLSGGSISSNTLPVGTYIVSYWSNSGGASVNGGTVTTTVNGESDGTAWKYYEYSCSLSASGVITVSGSNTIDELRLYPSGAQITTYTYSPSGAVTTRCGPDNKIIYYEYDGFNRLQTVEDQQGNIIRTLNYHYKQP